MPPADEFESKKSGIAVQECNHAFKIEQTKVLKVMMPTRHRGKVWEENLEKQDLQFPWWLAGLWAIIFVLKIHPASNSGCQ